MTDRYRLPPTRKGLTHKIVIADVTIYVTINRDDTGREREVFIKATGGWQGWCDILAETASLYLQRGGTMQELLRHWEGHRFDPQQIGRGASIPDAIVRRVTGCNAPKIGDTPSRRATIGDVRPCQHQA